MKYEIKKIKMPAFGVGPIFVINCLGLTLIGIFLHSKDYLNAGEVKEGKIIFTIIGLILIIFGFYLWVRAVIFQKINKKVKDDKLITDGVYAIVRNSVYSAFIFLFSGILFLKVNFILLILPVIFWAFLTILMKNTEEKWLKK